ncbi:MAG: CsbD family protein [Candidatus Nanopelagicales bacterium]
MSAQSDQAKGHAKEAAGLLTGDEDLQAQGKAERVAGEAKERTDKVKDTVEGGLDKVQHTLNDVLNKAKKAVRRS